MSVILWINLFLQPHSGNPRSQWEDRDLNWITVFLWSHVTIKSVLLYSQNGSQSLVCVHRLGSLALANHSVFLPLISFSWTITNAPWSEGSFASLMFYPRWRLEGTLLMDRAGDPVSGTMPSISQAPRPCLEQYHVHSNISKLILVEWVKANYYPHYTAYYSVEFRIRGF
jgi:hypothetical protein